MGKGKKKAKGRKRVGKKTNGDKAVGEDKSVLSVKEPTQEQHEERARLAASNRTEDPLKNWTRLMQEDCPICMLPMPFNHNDRKYCVTCDKTVCRGCMISVGLVHARESGDVMKGREKASTCPFCRSDNTSCDDKYVLEQDMKRANAGNSESMYDIGNFYFKGEKGLPQDKAEGLKWLYRAVEAGSGQAAFFIGVIYFEGDGVDKDHDKALEYSQKAAGLGFPQAFVLIGDLLEKMGDIEEGMINYRKAVMCGMSDDVLFKVLRNGFRDGFITREEYAFTLRENQKACNEMKSEGREMLKKV